MDKKLGLILFALTLSCEAHAGSNEDFQQYLANRKYRVNLLNQAQRLKETNYPEAEKTLLQFFTISQKSPAGSDERVSAYETMFSWYSHLELYKAKEHPEAKAKCEYYLGLLEPLLINRSKETNNQSILRYMQSVSSYYEQKRRSDKVDFYYKQMVDLSKLNPMGSVQTATLLDEWSDKKNRAGDYKQAEQHMVEALYYWDMLPPTDQHRANAHLRAYNWYFRFGETQKADRQKTLLTEILGARASEELLKPKKHICYGCGRG